jgi:hypothetical protein
MVPLRRSLTTIFLAITICLMTAASLQAVPKTLEVEGVVVPAAAWSVSREQVMVSCDWLEQSIPSLHCEVSPAITQQPANATITEVTVSVSGRDSDGCCAEWARGFNIDTDKNAVLYRIAGGYQCFTQYPDAQPSVDFEECFSAGTQVIRRKYVSKLEAQKHGKDLFVPLLELATAMRMPVIENRQNLRLGAPKGFQRTLESALRGDIAEARDDIRFFKLREPQQPLESKNDSLCPGQTTFWPIGEVLRVVTCRGDVVRALEFRNRVWTVTWEARFEAPPMLGCRPKRPLAPAKSAPDLLGRYIGGHVITTWGKRPLFKQGLTVFGVCDQKTKINALEYTGTKFYARLDAQGRETTLLWFGVVPTMNTGAFVRGKNQLEVLDGSSGAVIGTDLPSKNPFATEVRTDRK